MRRILLLRSSAHLGGIERQLLDHTLRLTASGWEPHLACFLRPHERPADDHPLALTARRAGLPATTLPDPGPSRLEPLRALRSHLHHLQPDLIHTCDYRTDIFIALLGRGAPWLAESHGHTQESTLMTLWNACDRRALRRAQTIVAVSTAWETALAAAGVPAQHLHIIGNSTAILPPEPLPSPVTLPSGRHLLYAGRLSPEKGIDLLLSAWPAARALFPNLHLWILGPSPRPSRYRHRLAPLLIQPGIHHIGLQPDIRPWLQAVDAVIAPSRQEAWGMSAFETLSLGVPLVAMRVGGLPQLCAGAPHALLIPSVASALPDAIRQVLDPTFPRGPGLGAAFRSRPIFDPACRHQRLLELYERVCA